MSKRPDPRAIRQRPWGGVFREAVRQIGCDQDSMSLVDPGVAKLELYVVLMGYGLHFGPEVFVRNHLADGSMVKIDTALDRRGVYYAIFRKDPITEPVRQIMELLAVTCGTITVKCDPSQKRKSPIWPSSRKRPLVRRQRIHTLSAVCELAHHRILRAQRKSGLTGRSAA